MCLGVFRYPNALLVFFFFFLDLYINQSCLNALGPALLSHYNGSIANHTLSMPLSLSLSLFSLLSLLIFLFILSDSSPPYLPTGCCNHSLFSHALLSISLLFFPSPTCHSRLSSLLLSPLIRSGLHLADCTLFLSLFFPAIVKDLDTEKYVHLVSTLQKTSSVNENKSQKHFPHYSFSWNWWGVCYP